MRPEPGEIQGSHVPDLAHGKCRPGHGYSSGRWGMGSPLMDQILADIILIIHGLFVGFVVFGLVLIAAGLAFGWSWATTFWFRLAHLLAIALVVVQAWCEQICPLTTWESRLRQAAGDGAYPGTFIQYWLQRLIFYDFAPWVFTAVYTAFGLLVLSTWLLKPPR